MTLNQPASRQLAVTTAIAFRELLPGVALSAMTALVAVIAAPLIAHVAAIPAMVIALALGIAFNPIARRPFFSSVAFCLKSILRGPSHSWDCGLRLVTLQRWDGELPPWS